MLFSNKKLVVFDFDGTLVDSMSFFSDIAEKVLHDTYGTPREIAREQYITTSGLPFFQQLEQLHPGRKENKQASLRYENEKLVLYFSQAVYPDAADCLAHLRGKGIQTAVSSNNFQNLVEEFIQRSRLKLDFVLGYQKATFCKGRPHFEYLGAAAGLKTGEILFVGDSLKDGERARDAGVDFVGKTGLFSREDFERSFPELRVIDHLGELTQLFE